MLEHSRPMRAVAVALSMLAIACQAETPVYVHRVALIFAPGSAELPSGAGAVLRSIVDDTRRECVEDAVPSIVVEEAVSLPLGKTSAGPTPRTHQVAEVFRQVSPAALQPVEGSVSLESVRARRLGLKVDQVVVELNCPPRRA